eukprot:scaffold647775_cov18-Prasinocladus_malaysianus.AAC.1
MLVHTARGAIRHSDANSIAAAGESNELNAYKSSKRMVQLARVASAMSVTVHDGAQSYPHGQDRRPSSSEIRQRCWVRLELMLIFMHIAAEAIVYMGYVSWRNKEE